MRGGGTDLGGRLQFWGGVTTVLGILPTRYSCSPTAHKMDTSPGGPSQQPGPTPAALVLARSGGMPRVGALRLAASSAPTRPVPQPAIAARQEEEQSRLAIGPVHAHARRADRVSGPARGAQRVSMRGGDGVPWPAAGADFSRFFFFGHFLLVFMGIRRPCYHALRQPVGAADRAMMHN